MRGERSSRWIPGALLGLALLAACGDDDGTAPDGGETLVVLTRNLFVGTSFEALLAVESAAEIPTAVAQTVAEIEATNFPERARELADEVAATEPHLIGIQEATLLQRQSPGDFLQGDPQPATEVVLDFVDILLDELTARGLAYAAVATSPGLSIELPSSSGDDFRLTDREVILARSDVEITDVREESFETNLTLTVGGVEVEFLRGYVVVDAEIGDEAVRFASTHLEQQAAEPVQLAQAGELLADLALSGLPVVLVGDFNSAADRSQTATYDVLLAAGFEDAWSETHPGDAGFTCCHDDLTDPARDLDQRLDLVLLRGDVEPIETQIVGEEAADRTPSGLWPSDHAGVVATLEID